VAAKIEHLELARLIRVHRKAAGLSQAALAKLAGVGKTVVFDLEHGKDTVQLSTLVAVLKPLNIKISFDGPLSRVSR
jgi:HTH-type transcriptional regulator/antitoxin HipB